MSRFLVLLRLFAAFLCGWLVAFLNVFTFLHLDATIWLALLLPFVLGIVTPLLSMDKRNKAFIWLSLPIGVLAVAGWYSYWLPQMMRQDAACVSCSSHGPGITNTGILLYFWIIGIILVLVSSLIT